MRSRAITILCIVLCLLAIAGFGDSIVMLFGHIDFIPSWLGYLTLIFGITAGAAAAGLWRMKRWGLYSLRAWFVACFILLFTLGFVFNLEDYGGITAITIVALVLSGLFLALDRYVSSKTAFAN